MADDKTEKKEPGFRERVLDWGKKFDEKVQKEIDQF